MYCSETCYTNPISQGLLNSFNLSGPFGAVGGLDVANRSRAVLLTVRFINRRKGGDFLLF